MSMEIAIPKTDAVLGSSWWVDYLERLVQEYGCDIRDTTRFVCEVQAMTARMVLSNIMEGKALARGAYLEKYDRAH